MTQAIILFAHGSRDPLWHKPIEAVAQAIAARDAHTPVRCAYLELSQPSLPAAGAELVASGVQHIRVFPMFLGVGKHAREDLPILIAQVKGAHPTIAVTCQSAVGEQERLLDLLADIALKGDA
jgi:sirohydrochlorin cobaltochelatase